jgi:hypothetical protein
MAASSMAKKKSKEKNLSKSLKIIQGQEMPTPEFLSKFPLEKVCLDKKSYALRIKDRRPIDKYHGLYLADVERGLSENYRRGINEDQFRAGDRMSNNYLKSFPSTSMSLEPILYQKTSKADMYPSEVALNAIHFHAKIMRNLSKGSQDILDEVVCQEYNLIDYENKKGWRKGYGMIRLKEALDELVDVYKSLSKQQKRS